MEKAGDLESLIGWVQRTCLAELNSAKSWEEVHDILDQHGLQLKERGNGLTLSSGTLHVKPSSVDRGLSKGRLEKRLGVFRAKGAQAQSVPTRKPSTEATHYTRQPLRHNSFDSKPLWEQYTTELTRSDASREQALLKARTQRDAAFDQAGKAAGVQRLPILYKKKNENVDASLSAVDAMLANPAQPVEKLWEDMITYPHDKGKPHPVVAQSAQDMIDRPDQERGSVLSTVKSYLALYRDPIVAKNVQHSGFKIRELMNAEKPISLYREQHREQSRDTGLTL